MDRPFYKGKKNCKKLREKIPMLNPQSAPPHRMQTSLSASLKHSVQNNVLHFAHLRRSPTIFFPHRLHVTFTLPGRLLPNTENQSFQDMFTAGLNDVTVLLSASPPSHLHTRRSCHFLIVQITLQKPTIEKAYKSHQSREPRQSLNIL